MNLNLQIVPIQCYPEQIISQFVEFNVIYMIIYTEMHETKLHIVAKRNYMKTVDYRNANLCF